MFSGFSKNLKSVKGFPPFNFTKFFIYKFTLFGDNPFFSKALNKCFSKSVIYIIQYHNIKKTHYSRMPSYPSPATRPPPSTRGFDKAGLYDPPGVGGTHVMYVLHHADRPELYRGLPNDPSISPLVSLWKGVAKPLATLALAGVALGSLFHYVTKGPNEVSKKLEEETEAES